MPADESEVLQGEKEVSNLGCQERQAPSPLHTLIPLRRAGGGEGSTSLAVSTWGGAVRAGLAPRAAWV